MLLAIGIIILTGVIIWATIDTNPKVMITMLITLIGTTCMFLFERPINGSSKISYKIWKQETVINGKVVDSTFYVMEKK